MAWPFKWRGGGEGLRAGPLRKKEPFFQRSKISKAMKLEGGGGLGLNGPAIKRITFFCGFPYTLRLTEKY